MIPDVRFKQLQLRALICGENYIVISLLTCFLFEKGSQYGLQAPFYNRWGVFDLYLHIGVIRFVVSVIERCAYLAPILSSSSYFTIQKKIVLTSSEIPLLEASNYCDPRIRRNNLRRCNDLPSRLNSIQLSKAKP
jgi:hypothetical protein